MKKLATNTWIPFAAAIACAALLAAALALRFPWWEYLTVFALMGATLAAALFISARRRLMAAKAIVDSAVIRIQHEDSMVYVSCFGILLGAEAIRFNQDGIWLKNVEIGQGYISFGYGANGEEPQNIRLLYPRPDEAALAGIVECFRKETGIVPAIVESFRKEAGAVPVTAGG